MTEALLAVTLTAYIRSSLWWLRPTWRFSWKMKMLLTVISIAYIGSKHLRPTRSFSWKTETLLMVTPTAYIRSSSWRLTLTTYIGLSAWQLKGPAKTL